MAALMGFVRYVFTNCTTVAKTKIVSTAGSRTTSPRTKKFLFFFDAFFSRLSCRLAARVSFFDSSGAIAAEPTGERRGFQTERGPICCHR